MDKVELIKKLDNDFQICKYYDVWNSHEAFIEGIKQYIKPTFQERACGLMVDFTENIEEILVTTFITENLFTFIKENHKKDLLIFSHHPYYQNPLDNSWHDAISNNIDILKNNKIGIYICHLALDFHPQYSTGLYLGKELISKIEGRLSYEYKGIDGEVQCEYYGSCTEDLFHKIRKISRRETFYQFSDISPKKICCSPGGGNIIEIIRSAKEKGVDTYITGISEFRGKNSITRNKAYFDELQTIGINIIGLGHYETECLGMKGLVSDYFKDLVSSVSYFEDGYYIG